MRVMVVDSYYDMFVAEFYARNPGLESQSYAEQLAALMGECFGTADYYSTNLEALGHQAREVVVTCEQLQLQWAREHGVHANASVLRFPKSRRVPRLFRFREKLLEKILLAQVEEFAPDVIHFQDPVATGRELLDRLRTGGRIVTAQVASYVPDFAALSGFHLVMSSFPHFIERFNGVGIRAALLRLGFEASIVPRLKKGDQHDVVFVGGLSARHPQRTAWLETIARKLPLKWWGYGRENLLPDSPLHAAHQGHAWGLEMYNIFFNSRIVLNFNEPVQARNASEDYANNMRLYEATGTGAMLVTDYKRNLDSLFADGTEVVSYRNADECVERVNHFLNDEDARKRIAAAGQARTLRDHTYRARMEQFVEIVSPLVSQRSLS
jgi:hypothetical protein